MVVKIRNRLGNTTIYGGKTTLERAEEIVKYLQKRKEYETCHIYVASTDPHRIAKTINDALDNNQLVRIYNDYMEPKTVITADNIVIMEIPREIIYPGFLNCTKAGTPCRVLDLIPKDVQAFSLKMSNEHGVPDVEEYDSYYGSPRRLYGE